MLKGSGSASKYLKNEMTDSWIVIDTLLKIRLRGENQIVFSFLNPIELLLVFYPVLEHGQRSHVVNKKTMRMIV